MVKKDPTEGLLQSYKSLVACSKYMGLIRPFWQPSIFAALFVMRSLRDTAVLWHRVDQKKRERVGGPDVICFPGVEFC